MKHIKTIETKNLCQSAKNGAWGQQQGNPAPGEKTERDEMREAMFGKRT